MAYTKQQIRDIIYAKVIDNVSEEITPEDMRYTLDAMTDAIFEAQAVASGFFFGPWKAQAFKTGWVAISSDGKKFWQALQDFNSATEPTANTAYWKLIAELKGDADFALYGAYTDEFPVEDADIAALQKADGTKRKLTWLQFKTWLGAGSVDTVNTIAPAKETIALASGVANITINNENPAEISGNATPTSIAVDATNSVWSKGRVLRVVANGSAEPTITGATKYPNDSGAFVTTSGTQNRLWLSVLPNNAGTKTVYYIWR